MSDERPELTLSGASETRCVLVYTLDEIKAAFWKHFEGAGELWFPYPEVNPDPDERSNAVEDEWGEFEKVLMAAKEGGREDE